MSVFFLQGLWNNALRDSVSRTVQTISTLEHFLVHLLATRTSVLITVAPGEAEAAVLCYPCMRATRSFPPIVELPTSSVRKGRQRTWKVGEDPSASRGELCGHTSVSVPPWAGGTGARGSAEAGHAKGGWAGGGHLFQPCLVVI